MNQINPILATTNPPFFQVGGQNVWDPSYIYSVTERVIELSPHKNKEKKRRRNELTGVNTLSETLWWFIFIFIIMVIIINGPETEALLQGNASGIS